MWFIACPPGFASARNLANEVSGQPDNFLKGKCNLSRFYCFLFLFFLVKNILSLAFSAPSLLLPYPVSIKKREKGQQLAKDNFSDSRTRCCADTQDGKTLCASLSPGQAARSVTRVRSPGCAVLELPGPGVLSLALGATARLVLTDLLGM